MTPVRGASVFLALLVFLGWFALLRPTALGGPANYVIVSGASMEPTYHEGDLVVVRRSSSYAAGDIVAYLIRSDSQPAGITVIHRIIGEDADGFITQGDNREEIDPWRATPANVRGAAWLHVPMVGTYVTWLRQPSHLGMLAGAIFLVGALHPANQHRRRRHRMKRNFGSSGPRLPVGGEFSRYQSGFTGLAVAAASLVAVFLVLGLIAFNTASHRSAPVGGRLYAETGTYDYAIVMEPSTLYPDGVLRNPQQGVVSESDAQTGPPSAFTSIAREAALRFRYELDSDVPVTLRGTVAADLVIRPTGGEWSRSQELLAPQKFDGLTVSPTIAVDLTEVGALIGQIEKETGLSAGTYELMVVARVVAQGERDGVPFESTFESPFTATYTRTLITPPSTLTTTTEATSTETVIVERSLSLGIWSPSVAAARTLSVVGFAAALGGLLASGGYLALGLRSDEQARIRTRYGARLVDVRASESRRDAKAVRVATIRDLARLAERCGSVILHAPRPDGHRYFVRDGDDTYEYVVGSGPDTGGVTSLKFTEVDAVPFGVTKGIKSTNDSGSDSQPD